MRKRAYRKGRLSAKGSRERGRRRAGRRACEPAGRRKAAVYQTAVYIRLSREDGDKAESDSVGNQRKLLMDFLKSEPELSLFSEYVDDGWSGTSFKRPAFERMIRDIEAGLVDCVAVKDLSRLGRDYIDTGRLLERYFPDMGVRFISLADGIDSRKQEYDMLLPIKNIFNEQYARDISRKFTLWSEPSRRPESLSEHLPATATGSRRPTKTAWWWMRGQLRW